LCGFQDGSLGTRRQDRLITAITGLVFDEFDLGCALDINCERLGEVLAQR
jgi:hypothetical protein